MPRDAAKLIAKGMIAALELDPAKQYIIFLRRDAFNTETVMRLGQYIHKEMGMNNVMVQFSGETPVEDVVKVIEQ